MTVCNIARIFLGQKWREMRATLSGSFTSSKMKNMFHLMNETAEDFVNHFIAKEQDLIEIELKDNFTKLVVFSQLH